MKDNLKRFKKITLNLTVDSAINQNSTNPVENKAIYTALENKVATTEVGKTIPTLVNGKIPSEQLPSYVDDVVEAADKSKFPETGESGKIYVDLSKNTTYRWSGSEYIQIKGDLVIGTVNGSAFDGASGLKNTNDIKTLTESLSKKLDAPTALRTIKASGEVAEHGIIDLVYHKSYVPDTLVVRDSDGTIFTKDPTNDYHAATKKYVDTQITGIPSISEVKTEVSEVDKTIKTSLVKSDGSNIIGNAVKLPMPDIDTKGIVTNVSTLPEVTKESPYLVYTNNKEIYVKHTSGTLADNTLIPPSSDYKYCYITTDERKDGVDYITDPAAVVIWTKTPWVNNFTYDTMSAYIILSEGTMISETTFVNPPQYTNYNQYIDDAKAAAFSSTTKYIPISGNFRFAKEVSGTTQTFQIPILLTNADNTITYAINTSGKTVSIPAKGSENPSGSGNYVNDIKGVLPSSDFEASNYFPVSQIGNDTNSVIAKENELQPVNEKSNYAVYNENTNKIKVRNLSLYKKDGVTLFQPSAKHKYCYITNYIEDPATVNMTWPPMRVIWTTEEITDFENTYNGSESFYYVPEDSVMSERLYVANDLGSYQALREEIYKVPYDPDTKYIPIPKSWGGLTKITYSKIVGSSHHLPFYKTNATNDYYSLFDISPSGELRFGWLNVQGIPDPTDPSAPKSSELVGEIKGALTNNNYYKEIKDPINVVEVLPEITDREYDNHQLYNVGNNTYYPIKKIFTISLYDDANKNNLETHFGSSLAVLNDHLHVIGGKGNKYNEYINLANPSNADSSTGDWFNNATSFMACETMHIAKNKLSNKAEASNETGYKSAIYLFGGKYDDGTPINSIYKKTTIKSITKLSATLPKPLYSIASCVLEEKCYLFGGRDNTKVPSASIYSFDATNETLTELSVSLPIKMYGACATSYKNMCYIFGGAGIYSDGDPQPYKAIYQFDVAKNTITKIGDLPYIVCQAKGIKIKNKFYIFGGIVHWQSTPTDKIIEFNLDTHECKILNERLPHAEEAPSIAFYDRGYKFFLGKTKSNYSQDPCIYRINFRDNFEYKKHATIEDADSYASLKSVKSVSNSISGGTLTTTIKTNDNRTIQSVPVNLGGSFNGYTITLQNEFTNLYAKNLEQKFIKPSSYDNAIYKATEFYVTGSYIGDVEPNVTGSALLVNKFIRNEGAKTNTIWHYILLGNATISGWLGVGVVNLVDNSVSNLRSGFSNDPEQGETVYKYDVINTINSPDVPTFQFTSSNSSLYWSDSAKTVYLDKPSRNSSTSATLNMVITYKGQTYTDMNQLAWSASWSCLTGDSMITLADGSEKRLDQLTLDDEYLSIDLSTGEIVKDKHGVLDNMATRNYKKTAEKYQEYVFSDGTVIKEVHKHRFFNMKHMEFRYLVDWEIGDRIYKIDGSTPELISKRDVFGTVEHFSVTTIKHHNGFANGCLYGDRHTQLYAIEYKDGKLIENKNIPWSDYSGARDE